MEEGGNLARTIPTSNPDPDQEQGGLSVWCGVNRQRAERSRALGPVRPTSDATRAANAAQPTARRRRQRRRPTHPRNTHERAATSDATNTTTTSSRCRCHGTAARLRGGRTHEECSAGGNNSNKSENSKTKKKIFICAAPSIAKLLTYRSAISRANFESNHLRHKRIAGVNASADSHLEP